MVDLCAAFPPQTLQQRLRRLADIAEASGVTQLDVYGNDPGLQKFEASVAKLLGKDRATFFPTGTIAQRAAIHSHFEVQPGRLLLHPTSHLVHHECLRNGAQQAKRARTEASSRLSSFSVEFVGDFHRALALSDITGAAATVALKSGDVLVVELPQRVNGGRTMPWQDLVALSKAAREVGARLHMDGARIWEVQPHYNVNLQAICELFDSVYVSFYKGLGGMSGAMLSGTESLIMKSVSWRQMLGANVFTNSPQWLDAQEQLSLHKDGFVARYQKLQEVMRTLSGEPRLNQILRFEPREPESCMVHAYVRGASDALEAAHKRIIDGNGTRLWNTLRGVGYATDGSENAGELYFEWNMGPTNSQVATQTYLEAWMAFAKELESSGA